ncbi:hypothetical protein LNO89_02140 [Klebsiella pneumoniae subsp. pneumoniae]|nr:hypothetical protein [Klebsiella pneumoniae subsp. pneumoniae]
MVIRSPSGRRSNSGVPKASLGLQDLAVNCRGGDMQLLGGPAQAAAAGHGDEIVRETGKWTHGTPVLFFCNSRVN